MKQTLFLIAFIFSFNSIAQDSLEVKQITYNLAFGKTLVIDNVSLKFKSLSSDSRCPKEVSCIRAGEAIATISVYINGVFKMDKQLTFFPYGLVEDLTKMLKAEHILIKNLRLLPYPKAKSVNEKSLYLIEFELIKTSKP